MITVLVIAAMPLPVLGMPLQTPYTEAAKHEVFATAALDPATLFGVGYGHTLRFGSGPRARPLALAYELRTVPSFSSWDLRAGAGTKLLAKAGFDVALGLDLELKVLTNPVHDGVSLNPRLAVAPGYFGERWFLTGEASFQLAFTSVVWHTAAYREIYPEVHDGFLPPGAPYWYAGARGGAWLGSFLVDLGFAWRFPGDFGDKGPYLLPYTLELRVGYRF